MLFNSLEFFIYLPIVLLVYFFCPKRARKIVVLIASYIFYMAWNVKYIFIILGITIVSFIVGVMIENSYEKSMKKWLLACGIVVSLAVLGYFKYSNFVITSLNTIIQSVFCGEDYSLGMIDIILPVGISFYIFQAIGYMIDVYRDEIEAEHEFLTYALFISFFPQLVAGPIERSKNLLGQIKEMDRIYVFEYNRLISGIVYMIFL